MRIALIGSAPSSVALAPYDDPTWTIWGCSPGAWSVLKERRVDAFFELHRFDLADPVWFPEYVEWMQGLQCPLYMIEPLERFPTSVAFPKEEMLQRFGRNFFTSSLAWMMALAITEIQKTRTCPVKSWSPDGVPILAETEPPEIGFWGVDMAATEEYGHQKPGCLYFIEKARELGIKVTIPPQSCLGQPLPLYGIGESDPMRIKLMCRRAELTAKVNELTGQANNLNNQYNDTLRGIQYFQGALDDLQYILNTWCE